MERIVLTKDQAISLLDEAQDIHTLRSGGFMLIGCDWSRESILEKIENAEELEIGGPQCVKMGHALVIDKELFVQANREKVDQLIQME